MTEHEILIKIHIKHHPETAWMIIEAYDEGLMRYLIEKTKISFMEAQLENLFGKFPPFETEILVGEEQR